MRHVAETLSIKHDSLAQWFFIVEMLSGKQKMLLL